MVEIKLRWRIKRTTKNGKEYPIYYISVPMRSAVFLMDFDPWLDPVNKVIVLRPKQNYIQYITAENTFELRLRWRIKFTKKNGKKFPLYYISIPGKSAVFLLDREPYLDPVNKVIIFKPKQQNNTQNNQSQ